MKCSPSKIEALNQKRRKGFTLIEMIGVLAVIAILAALLIPKVFSAINDARVNGLCVTCETLKTATADHYGKYGRLDAVWGTNTLTFVGGIASNYDKTVLIPEGLLDKPFTAKIAGGDPSANAVLELVQNAAGNANNAGYSLDGSGTNTTATASFVLEAVVHDVTLADAKDLNDRLDGPSLGSATPPDISGRVEYGTVKGNGLYDVYIYLTHR